MKITFHNQLSDLDALYAYKLIQTQDGKLLGRQAFSHRLNHVWFFVALLCLFYGFYTGKGEIAFLLFFGIFWLSAGILVLISKFKISYYYGMKLYKKGERSLTNQDIESITMPKTLYLKDDCIEVQSSWSFHRWKWDLVDSIGKTPDFIFLQVGKCYIYWIPKRDFSTEQSFNDLEKKLIEQTKKYHEQPVSLG